MKRPARSRRPPVGRQPAPCAATRERRASTREHPAAAWCDSCRWAASRAGRQAGRQAGRREGGQAPHPVSLPCSAHTSARLGAAPCRANSASHQVRGRSVGCSASFSCDFRLMLMTMWRLATLTSSAATSSAWPGSMCSRTSPLNTRSNCLSAAQGRIPAAAGRWVAAAGSLPGLVCRHAGAHPVAGPAARRQRGGG